MMSSLLHLKQRLAVGGVGMLGAIFSIYYSNAPFFKPLFLLLVVALISLALREYYYLARNKGFHPLGGCGIAISAVYTVSLMLSGSRPPWNVLPWLLLLFLFVLLFLFFFKQKESALGNLAVTLFGIIYLTIPLSCGLKINYFFSEGGGGDGRLWLAYVVLIAKMTDIAAFFCGKIWGRRPLAPSISPKKTVEGAIGGGIAALVASLVFSFFASFSGLFSISFFQTVWIGLIISALAQIGDLSESLLKRDAGVKDSSHLPGLGGILDIVDSLVFTLPFMYLLLKMEIFKAY